MTTKTAKTTAALVLALGVALGGATTAPAATASPIRDCARTYIAQGYTARDAVQRCSRELTAAAEREAAERRGAPSAVTCAQQHLDAGYTAAEARAECKGDEKPRGVIKPKIAPKPTKPATNPVGTPRNWWDRFPSFLFPLLIFGAMTAAVFIGIYGYGRAKQAQFRRQQTQQFAAEEMDAPYADYPEDVPPEPQYHVPEQQTPPPAYAQQAPAAEQQTPPSSSSGGSSASAFDDLI